jgi:hypothetical protein
MTIKLVLISLGLFLGQASAAPPPTRTSSRAAVKTKTEKSKKKTKEETAEELKKADEEEERKRRAFLARVVVLKVENTSTDYTNDTVIRNVQSALARPDAMFFPEVDLYQSGRKVRDTTMIPAMQPAIVPDSNIPAVIAAANKALAIPWDAKGPDSWGELAENLRDTAELIWFVDRVELREPLFQLYLAIGYAAQNATNPIPPFFEAVGPKAVNYYWYLAAMLAMQEPSLMSKASQEDARDGVSAYLNLLQQGTYPSFDFDFEFEDRFDPEAFADSYEVLVNGLPVELDRNAQMTGYLGRTDIYLKRQDTGHGLSERFESVKLEEKTFFVRENARKKMGVDFIDQLMLHKNECIAEVDGDILNYLAIYQKLHPKAEIYISVAEKGNPNKMYVWRYVKEAAHLRLVAGGGNNFPVRFAFVFSPGMMWNGASVDVDTDISDETSIDLSSRGVTSRFDESLKNAYVPFNLEFRMHYNRLMVNLGAEFGLNSASNSNWIERYYLPKHEGAVNPTAVYCKRTDMEKYGPIRMSLLDEDPPEQPCGNEEQYHITNWNRYIYLGIGGVFGRDAGIGFGPRLLWRNGWTNLPHAWQSELHFGWSVQPPIGDFKKRFRPLLDADLRAGFSYVATNSIQREIARNSEDEGVLEPVFGLTLGVGFTF